MNILSTSCNNQQSDLLFNFTNGITIDARLSKQEVQVQKAWLKAITAIDIITENEAIEITHKLSEALISIENGTFKWSIHDEDIHMHLEKYITEHCGIVGKKIHIGRSRNDLIATTLRLFVADIILDTQNKLKQLINNLAAQAALYQEVLVPGLTHLQHGQPVSFAHILLGYTQAFKRDINALDFAKKTSLRHMPLGSAALSGTPLDINLEVLAQDLGFQSPSDNSYDSVGDRDFILQTLNCFAGIGIHLSRLSEDIIYWASTPVGIIDLPMAWSTGSSIMPNKRNPDIAELTRGRMAHVIGAQTAGHSLMRTVATSYGSDLHELKKVLMLAYDEMHACLDIWPAFIANIQVNQKRCDLLLNQGHILATEVADHLFDQGVPFREAYKAVAQLVITAQDNNVQIHELSLNCVNQVLEQLELKPLTTFDFTYKKAISRRNNTGGTSLNQLKIQIEKIKT